MCSSYCLEGLKDETEEKFKRRQHRRNIATTVCRCAVFIAMLIFPKILIEYTSLVLLTCKNKLVLALLTSNIDTNLSDRLICVNEYG